MRRFIKSSIVKKAEKSFKEIIHNIYFNENNEFTESYYNLSRYIFLIATCSPKLHGYGKDEQFDTNYIPKNIQDFADKNISGNLDDLISYLQQTFDLDEIAGYVEYQTEKEAADDIKSTINTINYEQDINTIYNYLKNIKVNSESEQKEKDIILKNLKNQIPDFIKMCNEFKKLVNTEMK